MMLRATGILLKKEAHAFFSSFTRKQRTPDVAGKLLSFLLAAAIVAFGCLALKRFADMYLTIEVGRVSDHYARLYELTAVIYTVIIAVNALGAVRVINRSVFESDDLRILLTLPLPSGAVWLSKMAAAYAKQFVFGLFTVLPVNVTLGVCVPLGAQFYGMTALILVLLPMISLGVGSVLALPVHAVARLISSRYVVTLVVVTAVTAVAFWLYSAVLDFIANLISTGEARYFFDAETMRGIAHAVSRMYPAVFFLGYAAYRRYAGGCRVGDPYRGGPFRAVGARGQAHAAAGGAGQTFRSERQICVERALPSGSAAAVSLFHEKRVPARAAHSVLCLRILFHGDSHAAHGLFLYGHLLGARLDAGACGLQSRDRGGSHSHVRHTHQHLLRRRGEPRRGVLLPHAHHARDCRTVIGAKAAFCFIPSAAAAAASAGIVGGLGYVGAWQAVYILAVTLAIAAAQICFAIRRDLMRPHFGGSGGAEENATLSLLVIIGLLVSAAIGALALYDGIYLKLVYGEAYGETVSVLTVAAIAAVLLAAGLACLFVRLRVRFAEAGERGV